MPGKSYSAWIAEIKLLKLLWRPVQRRLINHLLNNFEFWQQRGLHVVPVHFYQPIPDTATLNDNLWSSFSTLPGLRLNEKAQLDLLDEFFTAYHNEYENLPRERTNVAHRFFINNGAFESVDAEILYCMIRHLRPRKIFEIGSGNTTYLSAEAILKNIATGGHKCDLVAFEPYPIEVLKRGFAGLSELVQTKAEHIPVEKFLELGEDDILFIDSSHVLKTGSDVHHLYLEVLPRLRRGVMVHIHDIFLPAEYPRKWIMEDHHFWTEQYLLQAFLAFNDSFEVHWAGSYMHLKHPDKLKSAFGSYDPKTSWPGSFWMKKTA